MKLSVNGRDVEVTSEADTPLLWVLRDELNLVGTKFGCGIAQCGACTVHLDGVAIRSCVTPVSAVANKDIQTIEGQATALLTQNPHPSDTEIDTAMAGNICRCGTYPRIRKAVHLAASLMAEEQSA